MTLLDHIAQQPLWLQVWINWMVLINLSAVFFIWTRVEPRWVLFAFFGSTLTMNILYALYGYEKILGLAHLIFWTPLLIYLFARRHLIGRQGAGAIYLALLFGTNLTSLVVDVMDVAQWLTSAR